MQQKKISLTILILLLCGSYSIPRASPAPAWMVKVDPWVVDTVAAGETEFLVYLKEQADLSGALSLRSKLEKGRYVFERLTGIAELTQKPIIAWLEERGVAYRPYWIANMIWVRGDLQTIASLAGRSDVAQVYANPEVRLEGDRLGPLSDQDLTVDEIGWNLVKVRAPEVWAAGFTGEGVVIAGQDTGYDWEHPALKNQYRGWEEGSADHDYNWHDAIHSGENNLVCSPDSPEPCDDNGHGTHTMGTVLGGEAGSGDPIGVAPGARWIACRNMDRGVGTPATYSECYQWFLAPTDLENQNPDPALAPDVINNSWGCPPDEGCTDPDILLAAVEAVRAAGIVTVHSAGNDGGVGCGTVNTPAAIYDSSFTVGNTDSSDSIAGSSSRGPVLVDGSGRLKPDISAPGTAIYSSYTNDEGYATLSGTSMAGPHVAGLVALLISAYPELRGQVDQIEELIEQTAVPLNNQESCGGTSGGEVPNNIYGWGRIDAFAALQGYDGQTIRLAPDRQGVAWPGGVITYTHTLENTGFFPAVYEISFSSESGWTTTATPEVEVEPGQSISIGVTIALPPEAPLGSEDQATLMVTSQENPADTASVTDTTRVGVPYFLPITAANP